MEDQVLNWQDVLAGQYVVEPYEKSAISKLIAEEIAQQEARREERRRKGELNG